MMNIYLTNFLGSLVIWKGSGAKKYRKPSQTEAMRNVGKDEVADMWE